MFVRVPMLSFVLLACGSSDPTPMAAPEPDPSDVAIGQARAAMQDLGKTLKGRLVATMTADGPVAAATVCATEAQALTAEIGAKHGAQVGRSSSKLRNPADAGPEWVQAWLTKQTPGSTPVGFDTVVDTPAGAVARVLKPLHVEAPCLVCHGPADQLVPEVAAVVAQHYPNDRATGYAAGDLRGAIWAEVPVP